MLGLFSPANKSNIVGVQFLPSGVAVSEVICLGKKTGMIKQYDFLESIGQKAQSDALKEWVKSSGSEKKLCHCLVSHGDYDLYQIEQPQVDEAEMLNALKWKVKDLLPFDVNNAVIDFFPMPESSKNTTKQLNVVAANESSIGAYVDIVKQSGLTVSVMDISELALKNIFNGADEDSNTIAVLILQEKMGQLYIFKEQQLYVVRDFKTGLSQLDNAEDAETVYDSIVLEIQRSVDYFESFYGLGGISKLLISPQTTAVENMANYLQNYVGFDIDFLNTSFVSELNQDEEFDYRCFMSFCAALRKQ